VARQVPRAGQSVTHDPATQPFHGARTTSGPANTGVAGPGRCSSLVASWAGVADGQCVVWKLCLWLWSVCCQVRAALEPLLANDPLGLAYLRKTTEPLARQ
jgi:hypothetical protein